MLKEYALYKGDDIRAVGTIHEIAEITGLSINYLYPLKSPSRQTEEYKKNRTITLFEIGQRRFRSELIEHLYKESGMTLKELSKGIGITDTSLVNLMNDEYKTHHRGTINKLIDYFKLEEFEFYEYID